VCAAKIRLVDVDFRGKDILCALGSVKADSPLFRNVVLANCLYSLRLAFLSKGGEAGMVREKPLINYIVDDGKSKDDFFGDVTICNVPDSLFREFMRTVVWPKYPGGISEALQDIMRKEVQKQKKLDAF